MEKDFNNFQQFMPYEMNDGFNPTNDMYKDPMFNPVVQYEQGYTYYKYLCMQMDYKIKCKEYEKMCEKKENRKPE